MRGPARSSRTAASSAEGAAALRAVGTTERDSRIRSPDHLAAAFVGSGPRLTLLAKLPLLRRLGPRLAERVLPGSYWFELARVRQMDSVLCEELAAGASQVVILGAGFDTRAYRFVDRLAGVATFEIDRPATAAVKRERLVATFGAVPRHVRYVDLDLNSEDLATRLRQAGCESGRRTIVIWSGVTGYLGPEGVDAVFAWLRTHAPGSSIVFDYCFRQMVEGDDSHHGAAPLRRHLADGGEPLIFGIPEGTVAGFLSERGFELLSDLSPAQLERRHLVRSDGRLAGRVYGFVGIAHARVQRPPLAPSDSGRPRT